MKKIIKNIAIVVLGTLLGTSALDSCVDPWAVGGSFLEKAPGVDVDIDKIFSNKENAEYFLWNLYNHIYNPMSYGTRSNQSPIETIGDTYQDQCSWGGIFTAYYSGNLQPGSQYDKFPFKGNDLSPWIGIRKAWIIIENIGRVPDMTDQEKSHIRGEAYLIMATRYFDTFKNYGGLPLVDHAFKAGESYTGGRGTVEQTANFIDGLLQKAIDEPGFGWRIADVDTWAGRLSKSGAVAMRAKLWHFVASPLFNDDAPYMAYAEGAKNTDPLHIWWGKKDPDLWRKTRLACEDFFTQNQQNGGWYALTQPTTEDEEGYCNAFRAGYWFRGNSEKIIEVHTGTRVPDYGWDAGANLLNASQFGMVNPTLEYMEMFGMADGKNYPYKDIYGTDNPSNIDIMANRDPRLYETILVTRPKLREQYQGKDMIQGWKGGDFDNTGLGSDKMRLMTGLPNYKWILDYGKAANYLLNYSYLRMADMHLIYAEALAETNDLLKALDEVNKVRARVGLGKIEVMNPELNLTNNKANLIAEILRERACEFGLEGDRHFDLIRRKKIDSFTSALHGLATWRKTADGKKDTRPNTLLTEGEAYPTFIYEKEPITVGARVWWIGGWNNKYLLSPIPRDEIAKKYGLTQNPGWN